MTVTDLTAPLLRNLLHTVRGNFHSTTVSASSGQAHGTPAQELQPEDGDTCEQLHDLEFSDAESVSDEADLFDATTDRGNAMAGEHRNNAGAADAGHEAVRAAGSGQEWDVGNVRVRVMDWKEEWDLWRAQTGGAADAVSRCTQPAAPLLILASRGHALIIW